MQGPGVKVFLFAGRLDGRLRGTTDRFYLITRIRDFSYVDFGRLREKADLLGSDVERNELASQFTLVFCENLDVIDIAKIDGFSAPLSCRVDMLQHRLGEHPGRKRSEEHTSELQS